MIYNGSNERRLQITDKSRSSWIRDGTQSFTVYAFRDAIEWKA